jgi:L-threonylcarbamoyladenylate synthase
VKSHSDSCDAGDAIAEAARALRGGGVVAFPTETVYGLGADAFNPQAVARVFELKGRPRFDPLIVHVASVEEADRVLALIPNAARDLMRRFWPGPLTLVLPKREALPDLVTAGLPNAAVRMPAHPLARRLLEEAGTPIAAPSANRFGRTSPTTAAHVRKQFPAGLDGLVDGGPCPIGVESTILGFDPDGAPRLLRPGGLPLEELEAVLGPIRTGPIDTSGPCPAPGLLAAHYAPHTPLRFDPKTLFPSGKKWGWLGVGQPQEPARYAVVESLGDPDDLRTAAARLFAALHRLDELRLDGIDAFRVPETGLGRAINDRLRRAAAGSGA